MYIAPCGSTFCVKCEQREACGGCCHAGKGKPFYISNFNVETCPIYDCAVNKKGYKTCAECPELPCQIIYGWRDPSNTEEEHRHSVEINVERLKKTLKSGTPIRKILLTSAGFNNPEISQLFLELVGKKPNDIKALFIPTAANFYEALKMVPFCMEDLLNIGIPESNIKVFDLHRALTLDELSVFDAVYFTGGSPQYLLERINDSGFRKPLCDFVDNGGVYVGVSAGAIIGTGNFPNSLGYLKASMRVHMETGTAPGAFNNDSVTQIDLTNNQTVLIRDDKYEIIGESE